MARSTDSQKALRLNAAHEQLARGQDLAEAAGALVEQYGMSRRQAYRYLRQAQGMRRPVAVSPPTVPITIKVPADIVSKLRAYAHASGLTIGEIVARAVGAFLNRARRHG
jgi:predicted DNA-binding transcriptional regulator YafY